MKKKSTVYIGTSGWSYKGWHELFYPKEIKKDFLTYYSRQFNSVEINSTFYRLQPKSFFEKWKRKTPDNFLFTVKLNRLFTHRARLNLTGQIRNLNYFLKNAQGLGSKWAILLIQIPPRLTCDLKILETFFKKLTMVIQKNSARNTRNKSDRKLKLAFEPRHPTWFMNENRQTVIRIAKKYNVALVFAESSKFPNYEPISENVTSDYVYVRFHGPREFAASEYSREGLAPWVALMKKWQNKKMSIFVYFNNDIHGYAVKDAKLLEKMLGTRTGAKKRNVS